MLKDLVTSQGDAGSKSTSHYEIKLSPLRYKLRNWLLPYIESETPVLNKIQESLRCHLLDVYFAWSANLASHTFYVIMLPLPFWFGYAKLTRDLVWVLGMGIYISGCCKDYFCLPRPKSPPLHRVTMSGYTAKEYGFPSSHSANATAVTIVMLKYLIESGNGSTWLYVFIFVYYSSLIFGRIYCGMHGFLDITVGSLIGLSCTIGRNLTSSFWDRLLTDPNEAHIFIPVLVVIGILSCVHFHAQPVDDCPCFDDSVAFLGVLMGLEVSHYIQARIYGAITIDYSYNHFGVFKSFVRVLIGVLMVVAWKSVSKKLLLKGLTPIYDKLNIHISRNFVEPVSESTESYNTIYQSSIRRLDQVEVADVPKFVKAISQKPKVEDHLAENEKNEPEEEFKSGAFKPRYDVEIVVRLIVYAGISFMSTIGFHYVTTKFGLNYKSMTKSYV